MSEQQLAENLENESIVNTLVDDVEQDGEPNVDPLAYIEQKAIESGWKPKDQFDGNESDWKPAHEYVLSSIDL